MAGKAGAGCTLLTEWRGIKVHEVEEQGKEPSPPPMPSPPFTCSLPPQLTGHTGRQWEPWLCVVGMYCDRCHGRDGERHSCGSK